jgi:Zn-dependent protease
LQGHGRDVKGGSGAIRRIRPPGLARARLLAYQQRRMVRFSIFGIPVRIHPFFWITLGIIGGALEANSPAAILRIGLFLLAGFISILVHELGHALTARKFGARSEITLQAFGGYAAYSGVRLTRPRSFVVSAAGPAVQILLGLALLSAIPHLPALNQNAGYFLHTLIWISLVWAVLNLLPILPLDGGQMLNAALGPERVRITLWVTIIVSVIIGLLAFRHTHSILLPVFLGMFAWQAWQALRQNP